VSATGELLHYTVVPSAGGSPGLDLTAGRYHVLAAYGILDDQFVFGAGFRAVTMQLTSGNSVVDTFNPVGASLTMSGLAPEIGAIIKPNEMPFRIGATYRAPVIGQDLGHANTTTDSAGVVRTGGFIVPTAISMPWELEAGFAIQVGPRPINPSWVNPHEQEEPAREKLQRARRQRAALAAETLRATPPEQRARRTAEIEYAEAALRSDEDRELVAELARLKSDRVARFQNWPREKILVVASALITGPSSNAIALEDFFLQQQEKYGDKVTVSPRIGIEGEPIRNWLKARAGSYVEPSRFDGVPARQHFTFGGDLRLFRWEGFGLFPGQVWRLSAGLDLAPRYVDWGLSLGAWH